MMKLVLLEKVANFGSVGEVINVKSGFGRNYLIPYGKAVPATAANIAEIEKNRTALETKAAQVLQAAQERAQALQDLKVVISAQAAEEGKLYGSVDAREIASAITAAGVSVEKSEVKLPNGVIRETGEHEVELYLSGEVKGTVKVEIIPEK